MKLVGVKGIGVGGFSGRNSWMGEVDVEGWFGYWEVVWGLM